METERIEPFDGDLELCRIVEEGEVKTFTCTAVLEYLDGPGFMDALLVNDGPVPVIGVWTRQIGHADVRITNHNNRKSLFATAHLDYATPERLMLQNRERVYAFPETKVVYDAADSKTVVGVEVLAIKLTLNKPTDARIAPVSDLPL